MENLLKIFAKMKKKSFQNWNLMEHWHQLTGFFRFVIRDFLMFRYPPYWIGIQYYYTGNGKRQRNEISIALILSLP